MKSNLSRILASTALLTLIPALEGCHNLLDDPRISPKSARVLPTEIEKLKAACAACITKECPNAKTHQEEIKKAGFHFANQFEPPLWVFTKVNCPDLQDENPQLGVWVFGLTKEQIDNWLRSF